MNDLKVVLILIVIVALVVPGSIFGYRVANTWTTEDTGQLLGGLLALCGGSLMLVAAMVGAGAFARLAGWKPPRRDEATPAAPVAAPYQDLPQATPPWGVTGGGSYSLLPSEPEDRRYSIVIKKPAEMEHDDAE